MLFSFSINIDFSFTSCKHYILILQESLLFKNRKGYVVINKKIIKKDHVNIYKKAKLKK